MHRLIAAVLMGLGVVVLAGNAVACPASASTGTGQQTTMTGPGTTQTPMPGKPGG